MFSAIFVDRPRLAIVIAIVTTIAGALALSGDPDRAVSRYRSAAGFGHDHLSRRNSAVVDATVAQPIEAQVVGVDKMIYMKSVSGDDGSYSLTASFELGTNPDINTVNVNNRVQVALSKLAAGSPAPGRHGQEEVVGAARRHRASIRRSIPTIRCSFRTTSPSTCSTRSRARPASATRRFGARRITRCAPGCGPTG